MMGIAGRRHGMTLAILAATGAMAGMGAAMDELRHELRPSHEELPRKRHKPPPNGEAQWRVTKPAPHFQWW